MKKILKHLDLWAGRARPHPNARTASNKIETFISDTFSQLPLSGNYLYVDPEYSETFQPDFFEKIGAWGDWSTRNTAK